MKKKKKKWKYFYTYFKKTKIAQIYYYDPQSAGINLQSTQSDSTPWTLTLGGTQHLVTVFAETKSVTKFKSALYFVQC